MNLTEGMAPAVPADLAVLKGWDPAAQWAPFRLDATLLVMNPFEIVTPPEAGPYPRLRWVEVASRAGISESAVLTGYPNPRKLLAAGRANFNSRLQGPREGSLDPLARRDLAHSLTGGPGCIGLYLGFPSIDKHLDFERITDLDLELPYGLARCDLTEVLEAWGRNDSEDRWWVEVVAFAWPEDRSWFLHIDPDSNFASLSCSIELASGLLRNAQAEVWLAHAHPFGNARHRLGN